MELIMEHICPICNQATKFIGSGSNDPTVMYDFRDYACYTNRDDHFYTYRFIDQAVSLLKIRLHDEAGIPLYLQISYDKDKSEVWTKPNSTDKINIGKAFTPNFSDLDKLVNKLKLYILVS